MEPDNTSLNDIPLDKQRYRFIDQDFETVVKPTIDRWCQKYEAFRAVHMEMDRCFAEKKHLLPLSMHLFLDAYDAAIRLGLYEFLKKEKIRSRRIIMSNMDEMRLFFNQCTSRAWESVFGKKVTPKEDQLNVFYF